MSRGISGKFYDDKGNAIHVCESYVKRNDPPVIYRLDSKGKWRAYSDQYQKGKRRFYRFLGFRIPLFARPPILTTFVAGYC